MFKKGYLLLILVLITTLLLSACGTKDLTKSKTGSEILADAYTKMAEIENYDMKINMSMKMNAPGEGAIDMDMQGTATFFQEPMRMKMNMEMALEEQTITLEQYMEQTEEGMVMYQGMDNQWFKMVFNDPAFAEMMDMDPSKNLTLYLENLEKAEIIGEEKVGDKETIKIEMLVSGKMYDEIMKQLPGGAFPGDMPLDSGILSKIGDLKGYIWVDKATLDIVKTSMDLTENMHNLGTALVENGNVPPEAAEIFQTMEMAMEYEILNQNKAQEFTIPEEAKNAQELPIQHGELVMP